MLKKKKKMKMRMMKIRNDQKDDNTEFSVDHDEYDELMRMKEITDPLHLS